MKLHVVYFSAQKISIFHIVMYMLWVLSKYPQICVLVPTTYSFVEMYEKLFVRIPACFGNKLGTMWIYAPVCQMTIDNNFSETG